MSTAARINLKMDADEKAIVAKAAALLGTTMAGFVRVAAKEKAQSGFILSADPCLAWRFTSPRRPARARTSWRSAGMASI
jgi:hypothetical protein